MTENKGSNMTPDDALEDTLDFQETVESLIASRPDLADPGRHAGQPLRPWLPVPDGQSNRRARRRIR